jgi:hypothetical protein
MDTAPKPKRSMKGVEEALEVDSSQFLLAAYAGFCMNAGMAPGVSRLAM